jgi:hypothetical protein
MSCIVHALLALTLLGMLYPSQVSKCFLLLDFPFPFIFLTYPKLFSSFHFHFIRWDRPQSISDLPFSLLQSEAITYLPSFLLIVALCEALQQNELAKMCVDRSMPEIVS